MYIPSKIICVGKNYSEHIRELGDIPADQMVVFSKPSSAVSDILHTEHLGETLHYECEICFQIEGGQYIKVGLGLDLTKRETQSRLKKQGLPWERAKAFNGAALFSDFIALPAGVNIDSDLALKLYIDDVLIQSGSVDQMLYKPSIILQDIASFITLNDGDVIMTGTPEGVGEVRAGAVYKAQLFCINGENKGLLLEKQWQAQS